MDAARTYRRAFFRLAYPPLMRPTLRVDSVEYTVTELSEQGLRVIRPDECSMEVEQEFRGVIEFSDGECSEVVGSMFRHDKDELVFKITSGISYKRMLDEQVRIVQKYPAHFKTRPK